MRSVNKECRVAIVCRMIYRQFQDALVGKLRKPYNFFKEFRWWANFFYLCRTFVLHAPVHERYAAIITPMLENITSCGHAFFAHEQLGVLLYADDRVQAKFWAPAHTYSVIL